MFFRRTLDIVSGGGAHHTRPPSNQHPENRDTEKNPCRPPRFHYLGDQPLEITNSLKGYNYKVCGTQKSQQNQSQPQETAQKPPAVYDMEDCITTGKGGACHNFSRRKCLKWSAPALLLVLLIALAAYLIVMSSIEVPEVIVDSESSSSASPLLELGSRTGDNSLGDWKESSLKEHVAGNVELEAEASSSNGRDKNGNFIDEDADETDRDFPDEDIHQEYDGGRFLLFRPPTNHSSGLLTLDDDDSDLMYSDSDITFIDRLLSSFKRTFERDGPHSELRPVTTPVPQVSSKQYSLPVSPTLPSIGSAKTPTAPPSSTPRIWTSKHPQHLQQQPPRRPPNQGLRRINSTSIRVNKPSSNVHVRDQSLQLTVQPPEVNVSSPENEQTVSCYSPRVSMCRGVIPWDLTTLPEVTGLDSEAALLEALPYFELVAQSGCSARVKQFVCSVLEPQCQPPGTPLLPPCRKACKAVAEECNDFILDSLDLSRVFTCHNYPDTNDQEECVNLARGEKCEKDEFRCEDGSCIPERWRCDRVKQCPQGTDELNCTQAYCDQQQFRCKNGRECIPLTLRCDGNPDCADKSDESSCRHTDYVGHWSGCPRGELRCLDGRCISMEQICDGHTDCSDSADEANCPPTRSHHRVN